MTTFFDKFKKGLAKTKNQVFENISYSIKAHRKIDDELLEEIEEILISGDVGVETAQTIIEGVKQRVKREKYENSEQLFQILEDEIAKIFPPTDYSEQGIPGPLFIIFVVGVNGTGKTTTIAKLANRFQEKGNKVLLSAADTFRAAAIEQLEEWAQRINVDVIRHQTGSDPAAVVFDSLQAARARKSNVLIIDTAGRLHTKVNLMEELRKITRVIKKLEPEAPHLSLLVLDATTGQNALSQARQFIDSIGVNGIALTKLDGTAKGGAVIGIAHQLGIPIQYVGLGEKIDDLQPFDPYLFARGLFED